MLGVIDLLFESYRFSMYCSRVEFPGVDPSFFYLDLLLTLSNVQPRIICLLEKGDSVVSFIKSDSFNKVESNYLPVNGDICYVYCVLLVCHWSLLKW